MFNSIDRAVRVVEGPGAGFIAPFISADGSLMTIFIIRSKRSVLIIMSALQLTICMPSFCQDMLTVEESIFNGCNYFLKQPSEPGGQQPLFDVC